MVHRIPDRPNRLDAAFVKNVTAPGRYSDGPQSFGLSLFVRPTTRGGTTKRFQQRITVDGRRTNIAVGTWPIVSLNEARGIALDNARSVHQSGRVSLPIAEPVPAPAPVSVAPTFAEVEEMFVEANTGAWRRPKTLVDWRARVAAYALPVLGNRAVDRITTPDIIDMLMPYWVDRRATAGKVAQAVSRVFAFAISRGLCTVNPADPKVLAAGLPRVGKVASHFEALPYDGIEDALLAVQRSSASDAIKLVFEWIALTACRSNEARGAHWDEIDMETKTWVVPASRMKAGVEHKVPLSQPALEVLRRAERIRDKSGLLFPSSQGGQVHGATLTRLVRGLGIKSTVHGVRSAFMGWAVEQGIDHVQAELVLAHAVGDATFRAYMRSDLVKLRRTVMERWAVVVVGEEPF